MLAEAAWEDNDSLDEHTLVVLPFAVPTAGKASNRYWHTACSSTALIQLSEVVYEVSNWVTRI